MNMLSIFPLYRNIRRVRIWISINLYIILIPLFISIYFSIANSSLRSSIDQPQQPSVYFHCSILFFSYTIYSTRNYRLKEAFSVKRIYKNHFPSFPGRLFYVDRSDIVFYLAKFTPLRRVRVNRRA